jgi:hypothetical protein
MLAAVGDWTLRLEEGTTIEVAAGALPTGLEGAY